MRQKSVPSAFVSILVTLLLCAISANSEAVNRISTDWITGLPRELIHIKSWPNGKKVAVCFIFYVEHFGFGEGPNFRPDMVNRKPDLVDEGFRQYAVTFGTPRVVRVFHEEAVPLTIALNALFPENHLKEWKQIRSLVPNAPIIAHGMNNTTQLLPIGKGIETQRAYIKKTLDLIKKDTGVLPQGWSSPSVYADIDTFTASKASGISFSLDSMDTNFLSRLITKAGPLVLIPYPTTTVDMAQYLERHKEPREIEQLWIDYIAELVREAENDPNQDATIVAIGVHPFVFGTPDGALSLRRVLKELKRQRLVWLTDVQQVMDATQRS